MKLPIEYILFGLENTKHEGGGLKANHGLEYYLYLILEDADFKDDVALVY